MVLSVSGIHPANASWKVMERYGIGKAGCGNGIETVC